MTRTFSSNSGRQVWSFGVAQAFLFEDQKVSLDDEVPLLDNVTPILAEATWSPTRQLMTRAELQWDWENSEMDVFAIGADWTGQWGQRLAGDYRYRRDRVDQVDLRGMWPISDKWRVLARANYSFDDSSLLEASFGVEYESCCWAIRTVVRRYVKNRRGDTRDAIYIELNLKGLASFGRDAPNIFAGRNY